MKYQRGKNLDDQAVGAIVGILDGWSGKLTWERLLEAVERHLHQRYTRQALNGHSRISQAFALRKRSLAEAGSGTLGGSKSSDSPVLDAAQQRIAKLQAENERLTAENNQLLGQFVRWAYNAYTRGLDKGFLDQPLPKVNRDQTKATVHVRSGSRK